MMNHSSSISLLGWQEVDVTSPGLPNGSVGAVEGEVECIGFHQSGYDRDGDRIADGSYDLRSKIGTFLARASLYQTHHRIGHTTQTSPPQPW
ncbi:hypothetical protein Tco_0454623 [Tanacetum coccineum]